jgi:hypothetical protein
MMLTLTTSSGGLPQWKHQKPGGSAGVCSLRTGVISAPVAAQGCGCHSKESHGQAQQEGTRSHLFWSRVVVEDDDKGLPLDLFVLAVACACFGLLRVSILANGLADRVELQVPVKIRGKA